jgi:hypothetical protein
MSRTKILIDKSELIKQIELLETNGPLLNRSVLFQELGKIFQVSSATIYNRFRELDLDAKTPLGKKGRAKGVAVVRTPAEHTDEDKKAFAALRKHMGKPLDKVVDKLVAGSKTSAIKLMCIECSGGLQPDKDGAFTKIPAKSIKECQVVCPLWKYRPYQ